MGMVVNPYWFATASVCAIAGSTVNNAYYLGTTLLIDADGQANGTGYTTSEDYYGHTLTYNGNAQITSNRFVFDGTGDYITIPGAGFDFEAINAATLELRGVKFNTLSNGAPQVLINANVDNVVADYWQLAYVESTGALQFSNDAVDIITYVWSPDTSTEYDISISDDGTTVRLYIDGQFIASTASTVAGWRSDSGNLAIGCERPGGTPRYFFNGSIRAIRLTREAARFTNGSGCYTREKLPYGTAPDTTYSDPYYAYVALNHKGEGADASTTFTDTSLLGRPLVANGSVQNDTGVDVGGTPSVLIGAYADYVSAEGFPCDDISSSGTQFCFEIYFKLTTLGVLNYLVSTRSTGTSGGGWDLRVGTTNKLEFITFDGSTGSVRATGATTLTTGTTYHAAIIRQSGTYYLCLDGAIDGTGTYLTMTYADGRVFGFGHEWTNSARYLRGSYNHVRFTVGHHRYNPAGGAFTPDTGPYATV